MSKLVKEAKDILFDLQSLKIEWRVQTIINKDHEQNVLEEYERDSKDHTVNLVLISIYD